MDKMQLTWTFIAQLIMFLAAMGILTRFLFKPMLDVFARREQATDKPHEQAAELEEDAKTVRAAVEEQLAAVRKDTEILRGERLAAAAGEERGIITAARDEAQTIAAAAAEELAVAISVARAQLATEANELADDLANKLLEIQR